MTSRKTPAAAKKSSAKKGSTKKGSVKKSSAKKGSTKKSSTKKVSTQKKVGAQKSGAQKKGGAGVKLSAAAAWTGAPTTLNPQQNATMPQTPNGTMIFTYFNLSTTTNAGKLSLSSGGMGQLLDAPALANQPQFLIKNFKGSNLSVSNVSQTTATPIWIAAAGPGLPGQSCNALPITGKFVPLAVYECAQVKPPPTFSTVTLQANSGQLTIFAIQVGNTVYVVALNAAQEAGPGTQNPDTPPPAGYYATTTSNNYQNIWNWGGATVYIINLSPATATGGQVSLQSQ